MTSHVSIDLETTGLDPRADAIIEIAAVRFNGARIEAEWTTLVNPNRPIPPAITQLTGITNEMVKNAPPIRAVLQELVDFIGDSMVVGQNVRFDTGFLQAQRVLKDVETIDTYELASVLLPTATRYNLGSLGQILGILIPNSHRALDDARLAHAVYHRLVEMAEKLPTEIIAEIVRMSEDVTWDGAYPFQQIMRARARQPISARHAGNGSFTSGLFASTNDIVLVEPMEPNSTLQPLNIDEVAAILEPGGIFSKYFPTFEYRTQQVDMLRSISQAFSDGYHLLVEAGTGTGKSFAYLIPAALWAMKNNARVVISTNTITLQEQLISKDIPDLTLALGADLRAAVLKGRSNYLCPRRLQSMRQRSPATPDEVRVLGKIIVWLYMGGRGDRSEINLNGPAERDIWSRLSAEDEGCKAETCMSRTGGMCPFYQARTAAQSAHLLIVNHALLLADAVSGGSRVLPDYQHLIVDEGHHIEAATTGALSFQVGQADMERMMKEFGSTSSGILGRLLSTLRNAMRPSEYAAVMHSAEELTTLAFRFENGIISFFRAINTFLETQREGHPVGVYGQQMRILPATRTLPSWGEVEIAWDDCARDGKPLMNLLTTFIRELGDNLSSMNEEQEDTFGNLSTLNRRLTEAINYLNAMMTKPDSAFVYWAEILPVRNRLVLQVAPVHIGGLMEKFLWHEKRSVILTSATLTTQGDFDYLRSRLNADEADELSLGSPFDYETSALLYLANDVPEPADATNYQRMIEQTLIRLSKATNGRLLALFTSYAQLKRTSTSIRPALAEAEIQVYEQGEGASANVLLDAFRGTDKAVLLGTRSFWEGVDIPGEALSALVIVKLPFDVPSDPIIAARSETFEDPFNEYSLPEAILRFRQGFGRLIRTQTDRGVVAILDRRVLTKKYGRAFIESLPTCKLHSGPVKDLPALAARWLNL